MIKNKTVVVYAHCGQGHQKAAQALAAYFKCDCLDLLDFAPSGIRYLYSTGYNFIINHIPFLWILLFRLARIKAIKSVISFFHYFFFYSFLRFLHKQKVSCVIATHFFPAQIASRIKKINNIRLAIVVTDLGVHPLWVDGAVDCYCVAQDITKNELISSGILENQVYVTGIPLREGFRNPPAEKEIRRKFKLDTRPVILVIGTTHKNISFIEEIVDEMSADFNIIVIYGDNLFVKNFLEKSQNPSLRYFPYYPAIWELMVIASFIVTKPGGLTVFEALALGKFLLFTHFIPGQEEINMDVVQKTGMGLYVPTFMMLKKAVYENRHVLHPEVSQDTEKVFEVLKRWREDYG